MKKILFFTIIFIGLGFLAANDAKAGASDNVTGWAWSKMDDSGTATVDEGQIGWISFNSSNCDTDNNGFSNGGTGCPAAGTAMASYGVNINSNGTFNGYAWSNSVGWISFVPAGPYPALPNYSVCLDLPGAGQACDGIGNYNLGGWARALSFGGGWEGWIKLRGTNYGVSINSGSGDFSGYAWSDAVIGWINFSGTDYKVKTNPSLFNQPPVKPNTSAVNRNECSIKGGVQPTFSWTYFDPEGNPQAAYEIEVDDNALFNAPKFNHLVNSPSTSYVLNLSQDDPPADWALELAWNTTYSWHVRVRDSLGAYSVWSDASQFTTPGHAYPWPDFSHSPLSPAVGEVVDFTDLSKCYSAPGNIEYDCKNGGSTAYGWDFDYIAPAFTIDSAKKGNTSTTFSEARNYEIRLRVTDNSLTPAGVCTKAGDSPVGFELPLPEYKEISPLIWFRKILAGIGSFFSR